MEKEQTEKLKVAISQNAAEIYRDAQASVAGNPDGDITVVEFFDYNCGYCKHGLHDVIKLVETDPKVRVVFKELPILSKGSEEASRVALAAQRQGKYWELHKAMLGAKGQMNEAAALQIAEKLGLDMDKLKKDMASPEVKAEIEKAAALAKKLGVNGTPDFLIGDRAVAGAPDDLYDQLERNVTELRKQGCCVSPSSMRRNTNLARSGTVKLIQICGSWPLRPDVVGWPARSENPRGMLLRGKLERCFDLRSRARSSSIVPLLVPTFSSPQSFAAWPPQLLAEPESSTALSQ